MSIFICVLFLLMACMDVSDGGTIKIVVNVGENYTFDCHPPKTSIDSNWYRDSDKKYISRVDGTPKEVSNHETFGGDSRVRSLFYPSYLNMMDYFPLIVLNMTVADSAIYSCSFYNKGDNSSGISNKYDTRVIGCSCTVDQQQNQVKKNVICTLDGYGPYAESSGFIQVGLLLESGKQRTGKITGKELTFGTQNKLRNTLKFTFKPFTDFTGNISCIVPALPTTAPTTGMTTTIMSTIVTKSTENPTSPTFSESTPTLPSMSNSSTTPIENPTSPPSTNQLFTRADKTTSSQDPVSVSTSYHSGNPLQNIPKETDKQKSAYGGAIVITISAVGSSVILMLVIAIVVLRFRRKRERAPSESTPGRHETGEEQVEVEETDMCYASIQDTAPPGNAGEIEETEIGAEGEFGSNVISSDRMIDNQLYDFNSNDSRTRPTTDPSTIDAAGPLYTLPDRASKSGSASYRDLCEAQKKVMHPSLSSKGSSDDVAPPQESQESSKHNDGAPHGTEDVRMGDLYAVPNKGPGPKKGVGHYTPGKPGDNYDKGQDVSALYAVVDRSSKVANEEPRDVSDLYAVVDKRNNNK